MTIVNASITQTTSLAKWMYTQGMSPEQSVAFLKARKYTIRGVHFEASRVASTIQGILVGIALATPVAKPTTPRKPRAKATPTVAKASVEDEIPF